jgi:hypothetical protein
LSARRGALDSEERLIMSSATLPPAHIDAQTNDGVVNTVRQLIKPSDPDELAALVIADHFDVLGYYDRGLTVSELDPREAASQVSGLLHSGSFFRDTEFFALYRKVADVIVDGRAEIQAVRAPEPAPEKPERTAKRTRTPSRRPTA